MVHVLFHEYIPKTVCENMSRNKFLQYLLHRQHANKYSVHIFANPFDTFGVVTANFYIQNKFVASSDIKTRLNCYLYC